MKILISHDGGGAHFFDRVGFQRVLKACGHECEIWNIKQKGAFDAFSEFKPDIFWGQLHNVDRATLKCLLNTPCKVALKAGHWGDVCKDVDNEKYPVLVASDDHKKIAQLLKEEGKLDFVHVHYHPNKIPYTMGGWNEIGVKPVGIMNALDTFSYLGGEKKEEFESDFAICSGYWPYKAVNLDKYIVPLCQDVGKYNIKIFGNSNWPVKQYLGSIAEENVKHLFVSTKINIDTHEPHGIDFGWDITERLFKTCGAGGFYVSGGYVESVHKDLFPDDLIKYGKTPKEFTEVLEEWLSLPEERDIIAKETQYRILQEHTYWDRVAQMFTEFGLPEEAEKILNAKQICNPI